MRSSSHAWLVYLTGGLLATGLYFLLSSVIQDTLYDLFGMSSMIAILVGVRWFRPRYALPWYTLAVGQSTRTCLVNPNGLDFGFQESVKRVKKRPHCRFALPKTRDLDPSSYLSYSLRRLILRDSPGRRFRKSLGLQTIDA